MNERSPEDPSCVVVRARLWELIDGELSLRRCETLLRHLDDWPDCMEHFCADARLKLLIATKCCGDIAPRRLRFRPLG